MIRLTNPEAQQLAELVALVADAQRISRGRRIQRGGDVRHLGVGPGLVVAEVTGSRPEPYDVSLACSIATDNERRATAADMTAAVPRSLDVAFTCSCPDWGDPCKHGVATLLELARQVDDDPRLLLVWRGIDDVTPPPPAGTESLAQPDVGRHRLHAGSAVDADDPPDRAPVDAPDHSALDEHEEPEDSALAAFFTGAMPDPSSPLIGPLEEVQLDPFGGVRLVVENLDVAPVFASAIEAVADHWLSR